MNEEKWGKTCIYNEIFDLDNSEIEKLYELKAKLEKRKKDLKKIINK